MQAPRLADMTFSSKHVFVNVLESAREQAMTEAKLEGIHACVFDAYGTLFDYASAAARFAGVLGDNFRKLNTLWREKRLQDTWCHAVQRRITDFRPATADAVDV